MIKLTCEACGATMELPDEAGVVHCRYCGNKVIVKQTARDKERQSYRRYLELCTVALASKNFREAVTYANKVLNSDSRSVDAWIYKAAGTYGLTTKSRHRYDEALGYLKNAARLAPGDTRIANLRDQIVQAQIGWHLQLANTELQKTRELLTKGRQGRPSKKTVPTIIEAIEHFIDASNLAPSDLDLLGNIRRLADNLRMLEPGHSALMPNGPLDLKIRWHLQLSQLDAAEAQLAKLRDEHASTSQEMVNLKAKGGLLSGLKISGLESKLKRIGADIQRLEKQVGPGRPKLSFDW